MNFSSHQTQMIVCVLGKKASLELKQCMGPVLPCRCLLALGPPSLPGHIISVRQQVPSTGALPGESFGLLWASGHVKRPRLISQHQSKEQSNSKAQECFTSS